MAPKSHKLPTSIAGSGQLASFGELALKRIIAATTMFQSQDACGAVNVRGSSTAALYGFAPDYAVRQAVQEAIRPG